MIFGQAYVFYSALDSRPKIVDTGIDGNQPSDKNGGTIPMELITPKRPKRELKQFTVTIDEDWRKELWESARQLDMTFHAFIKAVLYTYLKRKEAEANKNE